MYTKIIHYHIVVSILALLLSCEMKRTGIHAALTEEDANEIVKKYTNVLASADSARALGFWSSKSVNDPDFWYMHASRGFRISFSRWREFLASYSPRIDKVRSENEYAVIELTWTLKEPAAAQNQQPRIMRFYVVREKERWLFINPIDLLTRDWQSYESKHFIYHFPKEYRLEDHLHEIRANDQSFENMLRFFDLDLTDRLRFYKARSAPECGELILQPPANGLAPLPSKENTNPPFGAYNVISTSFYHPHEVAHCLAAVAGIPYDNAVVTEGFAVALGGVAGATEETTLQEARNLLEISKLLPLETLFIIPLSEFLRQNYITYYESGALVRFLYDRFGMGKLKEVCEYLNQPSRADESMERVLGVTISQLEKQFHAYLLRQQRKNIGFSIPPTATEMFSMKDPENDDTGDGDYVYPRHQNFAKGVFDLRQFAVLKDQHNAYFKITMSKLMTPAFYGSSDEQFTPCIVIAINYGRNGKRTLARDCHGVRFSPDEGYDLKLNIGSAVSVSNNLGKVCYTTPDIVYKFVNKEAHTIEVSIPVGMIGEPQEDWKYFVGIGLTSNRTMNFLYSGPMPVHQNHPVFISGGNFAFGNPDFIDILHPDTDEQVRILSRYDAAKNVKPIVVMIGHLN
ncbi:MAG: hypothetical protein FJ217_08785 [Ignavibacteria bacterium]|nr:hypothetical protein [Ignavibacteria bacterium]